MTNRERAENILSLLRKSASTSVYVDDPVEFIKHALDEAENRGFQIGRLKAGKRALPVEGE